eukprot:Rhum_TRINITY_DN25821_c0_g1::Rhum_TRINITY_DN25821_c0_g1_i1::g.182853::m.182853
MRTCFRATRLLRAVRRPEYWGGPQVSQWPSVPFALLSLMFWVGWAFGVSSLRRTLTRGYNSLELRHQTKARIVEARYLGFGFWSIRYAFAHGPKVYTCRRIAPGAINPEGFGEFISPYHKDYEKLTKVGSIVDIWYAKGSVLTETASVDRGFAVPYVIGLAVWTTVLGVSAWMIGHRAKNMIRYHALHTSLPGMTVLKRDEMHKMTKQLGESPLEEFWRVGRADVKRKFSWKGHKGYTEEVRRMYDDANRAAMTTVHESKLTEHRMRTAEEEEMKQQLEASQKNTRQK